MIVIGLGVGMSLPILTQRVAECDATEPAWRGNGGDQLSALAWLTLGVAIIGTVVNNTFASELAARLPQAANQLPQALLDAATNQQVLVNAAYRQQVASHIPASLFNQIVEATRQTLAVGIEHAFWVALGICALAMVVTFF